MKLLDKYVWPWKTIAKLKADLKREQAEHHCTRNYHRMAVATIKKQEQTMTKTDEHMRKMARIITLTSGFGS